MTVLQLHIISYLAEHGLVDSMPPAELHHGATAAAIAAASEAEQPLTPAAVLRCLVAMSSPTTGNADHAPRRAWTRQVRGRDVPASGAGRQWVATLVGAATVCTREHSEVALERFVTDLALPNLSTRFVRSDDGGRFIYEISTAGGSFSEVGLLGLPGGDRRWTVPEERRREAPRVLVDGDSWVWIPALCAATYDLTGVHPRYDAVKARLEETPC